MGIVEPLVGDGRAGDGGAEDIGPSQHGHRRQEAAERPAADAHPVKIKVGVALRRRVQRGHLVLQRQIALVPVDGPFPGRPAPGGAAAIGDHDGEPLLGKPLGHQVRAPRCHDPLPARPAVGVHQDR